MIANGFFFALGVALFLFLAYALLLFLGSLTAPRKTGSSRRKYYSTNHRSYTAETDYFKPTRKELKSLERKKEEQKPLTEEEIQEIRAELGFTDKREPHGIKLGWLISAIPAFILTALAVF